MLATEEIVVSRERVDKTPWVPFEGFEGIRQKLLRFQTSTGEYAGLMRLEPEACMPTHIHPRAAHHLCVIEGSCEVDGHVVGERAYVYVPPGAPHHIVRAGPDGCVLFYLYLPVGPITEDWR